MQIRCKCNRERRAASQNSLPVSCVALRGEGGITPTLALCVRVKWNRFGHEHYNVTNNRSLFIDVTLLMCLLALHCTPSRRGQLYFSQMNSVTLDRSFSTGCFSSICLNDSSNKFLYTCAISLSCTLSYFCFFFVRYSL